MKKILLTLGILLITYCGYGQQVKMERSTETVDSTQFSKVVQTYNRIIRVHEEKLRLFKVDLIGPTLYLVSNWDEKDAAQNKLVNIAYEQKINPNWSWLVESSFTADRSDFKEIHGVGGARYYYNMKRRILKGKSANNFSGNYLSAVLTYGYRFQDDDDQATINILYGIQRRLGRYGFIDFNVGLESAFTSYDDRENAVEAVVEVKWGLAF